MSSEQDNVRHAPSDPRVPRPLRGALDGVGVRGSLLFFAIASFWNLASVWVTNWSTTSVLATEGVLLALFLLRWLLRARWHQRAAVLVGQATDPPST